MRSSEPLLESSPSGKMQTMPPALMQSIAVRTASLARVFEIGIAPMKLRNGQPVQAVCGDFVRDPGECGEEFPDQPFGERGRFLLLHVRGLAGCRVRGKQGVPQMPANACVPYCGYF
jgi:hypothetical protein